MITREEAEKLYNEVDVKFTNYYKYSFTFEGEANDGSKITTTFGGRAEDIYRYDLSHDEEYTFDNCDEWHSVNITKDGKTIFDWDDY